MWQEAKSNEKKIKEVMADHKKRAERRRAYYNSKLGDPLQLLRIIGSNVKLYPNGEQYYYHENTNNLMPWQGDTTLRIDRFDGRSLLDMIPEKSLGKGALDDEDFSDREELNFERYRDLVEADRLHLPEKERLELVDDEWIKILDRHKELLALINPQKKKSNAIGYDYGGSTTTTTDKLADDTNVEDSDLLNETDILKYINDLTEMDRQILNDMGKKYGIRNYTRLLRVAKRDRDEALKQLQAKQQNRGGNGKTESKKSKRRKRKRRSRWNRDTESRHQRRGSPSYGNESYSDDDDDTDASDDDSHSSGDDEKSDFVIEFGSTSGLDDQQQRKPPVKQGTLDQSSGTKDQPTTVATSGKNFSHHSTTSGTTAEKKLTPMEKLKMKMRAGLEKTIQSNENAKLQKEQERHMDNIEQYAKEHQEFGSGGFGPLVSSIHPPSLSIQPKPASRYRSPSSSRSPSPTNHRKSSPPPPPASSSTSSSRRQVDRRQSPSSNRRSKDSRHHYHHSPTKSSTSTEDSHRHRHHHHDRKSSSSYHESSHKRYRSRSRSRSRSPTSSNRRRRHRHSHRSRSPSPSTVNRKKHRSSTH